MPRLREIFSRTSFPGKKRPCLTYLGPSLDSDAKVIHDELNQLMNKYIKANRFPIFCIARVKTVQPLATNAPTLHMYCRLFYKK
jgi:hypothetical protein